jgi:hypothetical protein
VPLNDPELLSRVHQTFRFTYMKGESRAATDVPARALFTRHLLRMQHTMSVLIRAGSSAPHSRGAAATMGLSLLYHRHSNTPRRGVYRHGASVRSFTCF